MRQFWKSNLLYVVLGLLFCVFPVAVSCGDDPVAKKPGSHAQGGSGGEGGGSSSIVDAPPATQAGTLEVDQPLSDVIEFSGITVGLHTTSGVSLLDMKNPREPAVLSRLMTTGRPVAVAFDALARILFVATESGDLRAYRVANPRSPSQAAQSTIAEPGESDSIRGLARVGSTLVLLGASHLLPVSVNALSGGLLSFTVQNPVEIDAGAGLVASGGGRVYVSFAGGAVEVWDVDDATALEVLNDADFGADIVGWVVRGNRLFLALEGVGLRVVKFGDSGSPETIYEENAFSDLVSMKRSGNLVLVALERGLLVALDLSDMNAPRPLVTRSGTVPTWASAVDGNLLLGTGRTLSVFGVPPFVNSTVPAPMKQAFPRYGRIPIQLSKRLDPTTVSGETVKLRCNGNDVPAEFVLDPSGLVLTGMPGGTLAANADCQVVLTGVKDVLGLDVSIADGSLGFRTASEAPGSVESPKASYPHTADGKFTDWDSSAADYEYGGVQAAQGMYSRFYANHDGTRLWMLNDWFYNGDAIEPDCYNQFVVYTGGGSQNWEIRAYGDQHIEVRLNGALLADDDTRVVGGYSLVSTPNDGTPHTVYEIGVRTAPGTWGVQLHDPGPTYGCDRLETDPTTYAGRSTDTMSTVDPTLVPTSPAVPEIDAGAVTGTTPTLSWTTSDDPSNFTVYFFEVSSGRQFGSVIFSTWVYGRFFAVPEGLLQRGNTFTFRVTAYNLAGTSVSDPVTFTVPADDVVAPTLGDIEPKTVVQGTAPAVTFTGSGFVNGAQAFFDGTALNTTYMDSSTVVSMLTTGLTRTLGQHTLTVRNAPSDDATESNAMTIVVVADDTGMGGAGGMGGVGGASGQGGQGARAGTGGQGGTGGSTCAHSECQVGARLSNTCSQCAATVCGTMGSERCCAQAWDSDCAQLAASLTSVCSCSGGGGAGGGGAGGRGGAAGAGGMSGGGSGGAGGGPSCFTGGSVAPASDAGIQGDCQNPIVIDLSSAQVGTILTHTHNTGDNYTFGSMSCGWGTTRNDVYQVRLPQSSSGFEVSVDPVSDFDRLIAVLEDSSCQQPENLCVNNGGPLACEVVRATRGPHFFGYAPFFVVGLMNSGNAQVTVRVRAF